MKDSISAFMDGELDDRAAGPVIDALGRYGESRDAWRTYHQIGDALRDSSLLSAGFTARVARALEAEPTVLAPRRLQPQPRTWYALAASVAAFALVGWLAFAPQQTAVAPVAQQQPAVAPVKQVAQVKPNVVPLPSGTNDYLLAHQAASPRVSLQGMAPYVRTVSEQVQESRK
jgi:sigma-E factor negative regulatory protein RseA